jgi:peptidoglycan hydrolase CwlO-like protein
LVWTIRVLVVLIAFLLVSSLANLVVSQRAVDSSRKQAEAIKQLTQSLKDIQRSIVNLSNLLEQAQQEGEESDEDSGGLTTGDGSI